MREQKKLTNRQADALEFIKNFVNKNGYPPSIREITLGMKCSSASTAFKLVEKLDQKGYIKKGDGPRAIKVINKGRADKAERRAERYKNLLMDLNDDLNVVEAREQILKEALEKIVRLGLGEGLGGGYKYKEEHHAKALSIAGTALTTLYPKEEEHGSAKTNL